MKNEIKENQLSREVKIQKCLKEYVSDPRNNSMSGLAKKYGLPRTTLLYHFKKQGIKLPDKNTRFTEVDKQKWRTLFLHNNLSPNAISRHPGINASSRTIRKYLVSAGLYIGK